MKKLIVLAFISTLLLASCAAPTQTDTQPSATPEPTITPTVEANNTQDNSTEKLPLYTTKLSEGRHDVSGTVTIYDDNTLLIENFSYDGQGPDVYISLGTQDDTGKFTSVLDLSDQLTRAYDNETLEITLKNPIDLSVGDVISIWCSQFEDNFGSGKLNTIES